MIRKLLLFSLVASTLCAAQSNTLFSAQTFTASAQTSAVIKLNDGTLSASSFSVGTITLTGTSLTTATFAVMASSDNGVTYFSLPISPVASPGTTPTSTVTATANALYQVNLVGITQIKFVTSGTFTGTSVSLVLTASPNGNISRGGSNGGGSAINPFASTTMAEYRLGGLSGTVVPDYSGNGNNGTIAAGGAAPSEQPYGLVFNGPFGTSTNFFAAVQYFTAPAAMPQFSTFVANICYDPGPTTWFPFLAASAGDILGSDYSQAAHGHELWANGPDSVSINPGYGVVANGSFGTVQSTFQGGCGVLTYVADSLDRLYWNGVEVQYSATGSAAGVPKPTTGYTVGGVPNGFNRGFTGVVSHVMFLSNVLSPAQVPSVVAYSNSVVATYPGIPQPSSTTSTFNPQILGVGDSLMCGWNGGSCSISPFVFISTNTTYTFSNFGVGKQWCEDIQGFSSVKQNLAYSSNSPNIITAIICGTNNVDNSAQSVQTIYNRELSLIRLVQRTNPGGRVLVFTKYSSNSAANDIRIEQLAALERAGASQYGYQLFDTQAIPQVGAAGTYSGSCFIDTVHPTQSCVQTYVSPRLSNKINQMDGSAAGNPGRYTATSYTYLASDNYVIETPTAAATRIMNDCIALTGVSKTIVNTSSFAITFSAGAGNAIVGSTTLAAGATGVFQVDSPNTVAGGVCNWNRVQ